MAVWVSVSNSYNFERPEIRKCTSRIVKLEISEEPFTK